MNPTLKMDVSRFNEGMKKAIETSSRSAVAVINSRAFFVCAKAIPATKKASRQDIEYQLGKIGTQFKVTKSGKLSRTRTGAFKRGDALLREDSLAARIIQSRIRKAGAVDFMLHGEALIRAARKLISARVRSIGFIRSGFISAMQDFSRYAFGASRPSRDGVLVVGAKKGKGTPAKKAAGMMKATIENSALLVGGKFSSSEGNPMPIAEQGLSMALNLERQEMAKHMEKKLKEEFRKDGFRIA